MTYEPTERAVGFDGAAHEDSNFMHGDEDLRGWVQRFWPQWRIEGDLGKGSFGRVFQVAKDELGFTTREAAKMIMITEADLQQNSLSSSQESLQSKVAAAYGEILNMRSLRGESNVVLITDSENASFDGGRGYVIGIRMELLEDLGKRKTQLGGDFSVVESMRVARDICRALVACHKHNIIHRDVKPQNVFWSEGIQAYKLGDLGASKQTDFGTRSATSVGTFDYVAPEVVLRRRYSANVDVYSLGVMLFYLLNRGVKPFMGHDGSGSAQSADQARLEGKPFPDPMDGDAYIADLIRSATAGNPQYRFRTAQAFYNAIEAWPGWGKSPL